MIKTHFPWNARCRADLGFPPPERRRKLQKADFVAWDSAIILDCQCSFRLKTTAMVWETHDQSFPAWTLLPVAPPWAELLLQVDWHLEQWQSYRLPQLRVLGTVLLAADEISWPFFIQGINVYSTNLIVLFPIRSQINLCLCSSPILKILTSISCEKKCLTIGLDSKISVFSPAQFVGSPTHCFPMRAFA